MFFAALRWAFALQIIGDSGVGFFFRFRALSRRLDSATTIGVEFLVKTMLVENLEIKFQLWDTGNECVVLCRESPQR